MFEYVLSQGGEPLKLNDANDAATRVWSRAVKETMPSLIVYIHGRDIKPRLGVNLKDGEPKSSFKEGIFAELESAVTSIMLHWPHSVKVWDSQAVPVEHAKAAAPALVSLIQSLVAKRPANANAKVIVVTHSTGSIVLEESVRNTNADAWNGVHSAVIASAASPIAGSKNWLEKCPFKKFVTVNKDDKTLGAASNGGPFLGKQTAATFPQTEIDLGTMYFDVGNLNVGHRYFVKAGSKSNPEDLEKLASLFFRKIYRGEVLDLSKYEQAGESSNFYQLRA